MTESKSVALPLGYNPMQMVVGAGFEPAKLPQRIYSPPHLTTLVPHRIKLKITFYILAQFKIIHNIKIVDILQNSAVKCNRYYK